MIITCDINLKKKENRLTIFMQILRFFWIAIYKTVNFTLLFYSLNSTQSILFRVFCIFLLIVYIFSIPLCSSRSRWTIQLNSWSFVFHWLNTLLKIDFHSCNFSYWTFWLTIFTLLAGEINSFIAPKSNVNFSANEIYMIVTQ